MNLSKSKLILFISLIMVFTMSFAGLAQEEKEFLGKLSMDQILEFQQLNSYNEAPELEKLVEKGDIPEVKDRLPQNPMVRKTSSFADGIGEYGGVWRDTFAVPIDGWNWGAGNVQGYFGIHQILHESPLLRGEMWKLSEPDPVPNLATDWEWSDDGMSLTMNFIEGAKWSDGTPFTTEDIAYTYNDLILDEQINSTATADDWTYGGEVTELEVVDENTVVWHFGAEFPMSALNYFDRNNFPVSPKHVYDRFHPEYNSDANYEDYPNAIPSHDIPIVTMGAWVPIKYRAGEQLVMVRNPYFWQVDEDGNQLPYISEVRFMEAESGETRTNNLVSGQGDRTNLENPNTFSMVRQESQKEDSNFTMAFGPFTSIYRLEMNLSKTFGVSDDREAELRKMFRDKKFRQALNHAIDKEALSSGAFPGSLTDVYNGAYPDGSVYHEDDNTTVYEYNPAKASELLAELGFEDENDDGILNWPEDSSIAGDDLIIQLKTNADAAASVQAAEALVPMLREVGINIKLQTLSAPNSTARMDSGDWDLNVARQDSIGTPYYFMDLVGPVSSSTPDYHQEGSEHPRELLDFEQEIADLLQELRLTRTPEERTEILHQIEKIYTENIYTIGLYQLRQGLAINNRFKNVQSDLPPYLYDYMVNSMPIQTVWVPTEDQNEALFLDEIPLEEAYSNTEWFNK
ncbi:MAG: ABC transporter substrate-binding protein [Halanaerobiales bacterium]